jgi:hypothetical protein
VIEPVFYVALALCIVVAAVSGVSLLLKTPQTVVALGAALVVELVIVAQLLITVFVGSASAGFIEILGYELTALLVPLGATALSTLEKSRRAALVITLAPLVVALMLFRTWVIWLN